MSHAHTACFLGRLFYMDKFLYFLGSSVHKKFVIQIIYVVLELHITYCSRKLIHTSFLTLKRLGGVQIDPPPCGFSKNVSSKDRVKPCFIVAFNITLKRIFPENFIGFSKVVQKIWRNSLPILAIFINFLDFLT